MNSDYAKFAQLLNEVNNLGGFSEIQMDFLAKNLCLSHDEIKTCLNRASECWSGVKTVVGKKTPLTEEQISEELAENGRVEAMTSIDFGEILGQIANPDTFLEGLASEITGGAVELQNIDCKLLFADNDTLYLQLSGVAGDE